MLVLGFWHKNNMKKICEFCEIEKDDFYFYKQVNRKDGLFSICKECHILYMKCLKEGIANRELIKLYAKEKHLSNYILSLRNLIKIYEQKVPKT